MTPPFLRFNDRFRQALAFLTILPAGASGDRPGQESLYIYASLFPAAGAFIGLAPGVVFWCASLIWTGMVPALLAVTASIVLTGALHEDGLADTADAFGGGWTREQRLQIMKDSRIGAFGALALILSVALRAGALASMQPATAIFALIGVHAGARCTAVAVLATHNYAGDPSTAKLAYGQTRLSWTNAVTAFIWAGLAMLPILILRPLPAIAGLVLGGAASFAMVRYSQKAIGGYCGDVLGAVEQLFEIFCLLGLASPAGVTP